MVVEWVLYDVATSILEIVALSLLLAEGAIPEAMRPGTIAVLTIPSPFWRRVRGRRSPASA